MLTLEILSGGRDVRDYAGNVAHDGGEAHQANQQLHNYVDQLHLSAKKMHTIIVWE